MTDDIHPDVARHDNVVTTDSDQHDSEAERVAAELRALADRIEETDARISSFEHERVKPHQLTEDRDWLLADTCYHTLFTTVRVDNPNGGEVRETDTPTGDEGGASDDSVYDTSHPHRPTGPHGTVCTCGPREACHICSGDRER